jgi:tRNA A-37 threonylcarbamoyl transferase component Bud32
MGIMTLSQRIAMDADIIHGDLTTSNMILREPGNTLVPPSPSRAARLS